MAPRGGVVQRDAVVASPVKWSHSFVLQQKHATKLQKKQKERTKYKINV
jgi:hypothetical protein